MSEEKVIERIKIPSGTMFRLGVATHPLWNGINPMRALYDSYVDVIEKADGSVFYRYNDRIDADYFCFAFRQF